MARKPVNPINTTHSRDAALRQLGKFNRGLIAGSIVLTAVLTDVAANAFPGKSTRHSSAAKTGGQSKTTTAPSESSPPLAPPSQAPSASAESSQRPESSQTPEESQQVTPESSQQAAPEQSQQPAPEQTAPETEPTPQTAPEQESSGPVISGGS